MPILKSSKKALKVSLRRKKENLSRKQRFRQAIKQVKKAVGGDEKNLEQLLRSAKSAIDRAVKSKVIHRNKAARLKSRLAARINTAKKASK